MAETIEVEEKPMSLVIEARYEDGVFLPESPPDLAPAFSRKIDVEPSVPASETPSEISIAEHRQAMARFLAMAKDFSSVPRLTRDQLHDRD